MSTATAFDDLGSMGVRVLDSDSEPDSGFDESEEVDPPGEPDEQVEVEPDPAAAEPAPQD